MNSSDTSEYLDLEKDLPTTEADIAALRHASRSQGSTLAKALELLSGLDVFAGEQDDRVASEDWEPFRL